MEGSNPDGQPQPTAHDVLLSAEETVAKFYKKPNKLTTLDLGREWEDIRRQLLALIEPSA